MSARPMTKSVAKKAAWAATNELDKAAKALAAREHIPMVEALAIVMKEQHREAQS